MVELALCVSIIALIIAYLAYTKSKAATKALNFAVEDPGIATETLRSKTADILQNLEKKIRGEEKKFVCHPDTKGHTQQDVQG